MNWPLFVILTPWVLYGVGTLVVHGKDGPRVLVVQLGGLVAVGFVLVLAGRALGI